MEEPVVSCEDAILCQPVGFHQVLSVHFSLQKTLTAKNHERSNNSVTSVRWLVTGCPHYEEVPAT